MPIDEDDDVEQSSAPNMDTEVLWRYGTRKWQGLTCVPWIFKGWVSKRYKNCKEPNQGIFAYNMITTVAMRMHYGVLLRAFNQTHNSPHTPSKLYYFRMQYISRRIPDVKFSEPMQLLIEDLTVY